MDNSDRKVDFGFEKVAWGDKAERVRSVFASVAGKYDVMNDLMSFGVHRLWKQFTLSLTGLRPGQRALDVAGGTGDLARGNAAAGGQDRAGRAVGRESRDAGNRPRPAARPGLVRRMSSASSPTPNACPSRTTPSIASPSASGCAM